MLVVSGRCGGFSWQSHRLVVLGRGRVLMAFPDAGCGLKRRGFHGSPICWLWAERWGFGWQF